MFLKHPDQRTECGLECAECLGVSLFRAVLLSISSELAQLCIVCTVSCLLFPLSSLFSTVFLMLSVHDVLSVSYPCPSLSRSPSCSDWQVRWCLPLLSPTFNSQKCAHKHAHTAHSKTANGFYLCRLSLGNYSPSTPEMNPTDTQQQNI